MKKLLIAMNNEDLINKLKKCGKYEIHKYDLDNKEDVIDYIKLYSVDVLITKDDLKGNLTKEEYIKSIKTINKDIKIILCATSIDEQYKGFLLSNNVFNIIEGEEFKLSDVLEMIDSNQKMLLLKNNTNIQTKQLDTKINIVTKQKVCVFGTSGAGKSYVSSLIAQIMSRKLKLNTLLVDMDIQNAAIDIYNNLTSSGNNLEYVMEEIDRGSFDSVTLQDIISKEKRRNGKLSFITNNMGIYECQNKISDEYYEKLYSETENKYDVLILDMPNAPFLDVVPYSLKKADKIFFVINPNFISIRQAMKYLDLITNIWKIPKENIYIVVNRIRKNSLDVKQIKSILKDYTVCMSILEDDKIEGIINGVGEFNDSVEKVDNINNVLDLFVDKSGIEELAKLKLGELYDN